jgi:hypothetical protein
VFQSFNDQKEALKSALKIVKAITIDYKVEPYIFIENKTMTFDGIEMDGVIIYSGDIGWSCFIEKGFIKGQRVGPLGTKLDLFLNTNYEA